MANPSIKNGHIDIANELVDVLAKTHLTGNEHQIIWAVWRKTWGWKYNNKKKDFDWISLSQLEKITSLNRVAVCRAKKLLVSKMILLEKNGKIGFNQDYSIWVVSKMTLVSKTATGSVKNGNTGSVENDTYKRYITKDTNTKEIMFSQKEILESIKGITTGDRYAPDFKSPLNLKISKSHKNKGQEFGAMVIRLGYVFLEEYQKKMDEVYLGGNFSVSPIADSVSRRKKEGATEEEIAESVRLYFTSKKADDLVITLNAAFSDATWLAYKQRNKTKKQGVWN